MQSTTYIVHGMDDDRDARIIKGRLYHVTGIGGVATEILPGVSRVFLKHKDGVVLDRSVLEEALQQVGDYTLE